MKSLFAAGLLAVLFAASPARAETITIGNWSIDHDELYSEASTLSDGGTRLGINCNAKSRDCVFYLNLGTTCTVGDKVPGLLNTPSSATHVTFECLKLGDSHFSVFDDFATIERILTAENRLGVVIPLVDGQFKVARYSLRGAARAIEEARKLKRAGPIGDQTI